MTKPHNSTLNGTIVTPTCHVGILYVRELKFTNTESSQKACWSYWVMPRYQGWSSGDLQYWCPKLKMDTHMQLNNMVLKKKQGSENEN